MLARYMQSSSVSPSVCLSQTGTVQKELNARSSKQRYTIASEDVYTGIANSRLAATGTYILTVLPATRQLPATVLKIHAEQWN